MKESIGIAVMVAVLFLLFDPERLGRSVAQVVNSYNATVTTD